MRKAFSITLLVTWAGFVAWAVSAREPLTFEERVRAQEAIERVYYDHRIWPKENPGPKPPFEQIVPKAQIEGKVAGYLKMSAALEQFWQRPITGDQLQAEMERMVRNTKDAATLRELFASLGNDPRLIAECVARPALASRLLNTWFAFDGRFHADARTLAESSLSSLGDRLLLCPEGRYERTSFVLRGLEEGPATHQGQDAHGEVPLSPAQFERAVRQSPEEGAVPLLRETPEAFLLVRTLQRSGGRLETETLAFRKQTVEEWLGTLQCHAPAASVESPDFHFSLPEVRSTSCVADWSNGILDDGLTPRSIFTAVWTGSEMIVWGGIDSDFSLNTGARYNPVTDSWRQLPTGANCPVARHQQTAVWTGTEMIVWGGITNGTPSRTNTGGRFNPETESWIPTSTGTHCPESRSNHLAVWTGAEMVVWGGAGAALYNSGGRYNPGTDTWAPTSVGADTPCYRFQASAVWSGTEMIVWGGSDGGWSASYQTGGRYNPATDTWVATSLGANCPSARRAHSAVWTGTEMIVWGGVTSTGGVTNAGARYNPADDTWTPMPTGAGCPSGRHSQVMVWTGTEAVLWGGDLSYNAPVSTGARYRPGTDSWTPIATGASWPWVDPLNCRAVWTGTEMIVWGADSTSRFDKNAGGRYNPSSDSWTRVPPTYTPNGRSSHTAVWTGAEMIVWGGTDSFAIATGARYTPATDSWTATPDPYTPPPGGTNCPSMRYDHTAVWDGTEMIVWGGALTSGSSTTYRNTGGRYNPSSNTWLTTSTGAGVPAARSGHTAVWTGTEMIVWGGRDETYLYSSGGRYTPSSDTWTTTSVGVDCPSPRTYHGAVWTGTELVIWGGFGASTTCYNTGGRYSPSSDTWRSTSTGAGVPSARLLPSLVWTGTEVVAWGGLFYDGANHWLNTGARYNPTSDLWSPTSPGDGTPSARSEHSAVWTGSEMIVWGGWNGSSEFDTGGRYSPSADTWVPTSTAPDCPLPRAAHTAVWTGTEMIVWGGTDGVSYLCTGGRYRPTCTCPALSLSPASLPDGSPGTPYSQSFTTSGGTSPYTWALTSGTLPTGLTLSVAGVLTGTPTESGSFDFGLTVTDARGCSGTQSYSIPICALPTMTGPSSGCAYPGVTLTSGSHSTYQWFSAPAVTPNTLRVEATCAGGANAYCYDVLASPAYAILSGDVLEYDLYLAPTCPQFNAGLDLIASGWCLRDSAATDQNGVSAHPAVDLAAWAAGRWYHRVIPIPASGVGKSLTGAGSGVFLALEGDAAGQYEAYTANIRITRTGATQLLVYGSAPSYSYPADTGFSFWSGYTPGTESVSAGGAAVAGATAASCQATASGDYSVAVTDLNGCEGLSSPFTVTLAAGPSSPGDSLRAAKSGSSTVLTWSACAGATAYPVMRNTTPAASPAAFSLLESPAAPSCTDPETVAPGAVYWYRVEATDGACSTP